MKTIEVEKYCKNGEKNVMVNRTMPYLYIPMDRIKVL